MLEGSRMHRQLQKADCAFYAGILSDNDIDYQLARLLAAETVVVPAFEPIPDEAYARAVELVDACDEVIDAGTKVGPGNERVGDLLAYAEAAGKLVRM